MTIINTYPDNMTIKERYALTKSPKITRMSEAVGSVLCVKAYCHYEDTDKDGNTREILTIMDQDGDVYATNSASFLREFLDILALAQSADLPVSQALESIEILSGTSKAGRQYLTCAMV